MTTLNLSSCNYQRLIFITKVSWVTYFIHGCWQPISFSNLTSWCLSCLDYIFKVIYITTFKQGVDIPQIFCQDKCRNSILFKDGLLGEVQQNPGKICIFHFPATVWLVSNTKSEKSTSLPENLMWVEIAYHIILMVGDSVLLGGFELGDKVLVLLVWMTNV